MKALFAIILSVVSASLSLGQDVNKPIVRLGPEDVIQRIIASGGYEGHDVKIIGPMGDAAAVMVTKILAGKTPSAIEIDSSLLILNMAFADPSMVEIAPDRKPRAALFVLQAFERSVQDAALKKRIAETRQYIQARYAATTKDSSSK
jgi:hypothetical protein